MKIKNIWNHQLPVVFLCVYKAVLQKYMLPSCSTFRVISLQDLNVFNSFCWRQKPLELLTFQNKNVVVKHESLSGTPCKKTLGTIFWTLGGIFVSLKNKFMETFWWEILMGTPVLSPRSRSFLFFPIFSYPEFIWALRVLGKKGGHLVSLKHMPQFGQILGQILKAMYPKI